MTSSPITSWQIDGETMETVRDCFLGLQGHCGWWLQPWDWKTLASWKKSYDQPRQHIKKQRHYFANKGLSSQSYGFSSSHVWMCELNHEDGWLPKNWCFLNCGVGEDSWESLGLQVNPKGNQSWIFIGRTNAENEAPILWPPDSKNWLIGKDPDARKDWRQEKKGTENEMVGWHHQLNGHEFEQALGVGDGQGSLAFYSPWGHKESDTNWATELNWRFMTCFYTIFEYSSSLSTYNKDNGCSFMCVCVYVCLSDDRNIICLKSHVLVYVWENFILI